MVESDPVTFQRQTDGVNLPKLLEPFISEAYTHVRDPLLSFSAMQAKGLTTADNLQFVKERRLVSQLIVVIIRDFDQVIDENTLQQLASHVWTLSVQNLTYMLPFYQERILFGSEEQRMEANQ